MPHSHSSLCARLLLAKLHLDGFSKGLAPDVLAGGFADVALASAIG